MADSWLQVENRAGPAVGVGETRLVPLAQVVRLGPPHLPVGLVWNRPLAVVAHAPDGRSQVLPVHDATRRAQLILLGAGLLGSLLLWLTFGRRGR